MVDILTGGLKRLSKHEKRMLYKALIARKNNQEKKITFKKVKRADGRPPELKIKDETQVYQIRVHGEVVPVIPHFRRVKGDAPANNAQDGIEIMQFQSFADKRALQIAREFRQQQREAGFRIPPRQASAFEITREDLDSALYTPNASLPAPAVI